jgi:hypothetical protein
MMQKRAETKMQLELASIKSKKNQDKGSAEGS